MALASVPTTRILKEWSMTHDPKPSISQDLSRRDFLTIVLATAPAAAVAGRRGRLARGSPESMANRLSKSRRIRNARKPKKHSCCCRISMPFVDF